MGARLENQLQLREPVFASVVIEGASAGKLADPDTQDSILIRLTELSRQQLQLIY